MTQYIATGCDNVPVHGCEDRPEDRPQAPTRIYELDGVKGKRAIETCDDCDEDMTVSALRFLLETYGRAVKPGDNALIQRPNAGRPADPDTPYPFLCLDINCSFAYTGSSGIAHHYQRIHDMKGGRILSPAMRQCPLCPSEAKGPTALGQHVSSQHPDVQGGLYGAVCVAAQGDDEYGVVAEIIAWLQKNGAQIK